MFAEKPQADGPRVRRFRASCVCKGASAVRLHFTHNIYQKPAYLDTVGIQQVSVEELAGQSSHDDVDGRQGVERDSRAERVEAERVARQQRGVAVRNDVGAAWRKSVKDCFVGTWEEKKKIEKREREIQYQCSLRKADRRQDAQRHHCPRCGHSR